MTKFALFGAVAAAALLAAAASPAQAQFYKGKTITILNGSAAGGGIDLLV